ncbi:prenyltransferase/squalene oxidase repeat-containing protein [Streptomyces apocyni]|uniref:prenyltransferase/squalene oxidase repeat-containing protein n=1 Tax=Streptomyces apocyni TaxID=2654677 RepID=UPI0012E9A9CC|nr:prenyltransferase/squalene oxidase repeat-containing protein [Streptomyces apocyni]
MNVRRSAAALAATAVLCAAAAPAAVADDSPSPSAPSAPVSLPSGLYGDADPQYDGVFRQSYALLAQDTAGVKPAAKAVEWLTRQQCASGGFAAFRADPTEPCDSKTEFALDSTAAAIQALNAVGGQDAAKAQKKATDWLKSVQNDDGGWGYTTGADSDVNTTGMVIGALAASDTKPESVTSPKDKSPYDALLALSLDCDKGDGAFGLADFKTGELDANPLATAAGVLGALGEGLGAKPGEQRAAAPKCAKADTAEQAAVNGAGYLTDALAKDGYLTAATPGADAQPDYGTTADAVAALGAAGLGDQAKDSVAWLEKNAASWAEEKGPAAYAKLIFAARATGGDARDFGGTDLVSALNKTGPAPQADGTSDKSDESKTASDSSDSDSDSVAVWWIIGVGLVAGVGIGFLISARNKKKQQ